MWMKNVCSYTDKRKNIENQNMHGSKSNILRILPELRCVVIYNFDNETYFASGFVFITSSDSFE